MDRIRELEQQYSGKPDEEIIAELTALPVLPDEEATLFPPDPAQDQQLLKFLAIAEITQTRKLKQAVPLLLERASYGDYGESMRGLRHALEAAYNPDWKGLASVCIETMKSPNRGARLWAAHELGILREPIALPALKEALHDPAKLICMNACTALARIVREHPQYKEQVILVIEKHIRRYQQTTNHFQEIVEDLQELSE